MTTPTLPRGPLRSEGHAGHGTRVNLAGLDLVCENAKGESTRELGGCLGMRLRKAREQHNLTQTALAERMGSSQSRVAKMEAGDPAVSLDLLFQGLLAAGATPRDIATALAPRKKAANG